LFQQQLSAADPDLFDDQAAMTMMLDRLGVTMMPDHMVPVLRLVVPRCDHAFRRGNRHAGCLRRQVYRKYRACGDERCEQEIFHFNLCDVNKGCNKRQVTTVPALQKV
jgi:hypothetical protein